MPTPTAVDAALRTALWLLLGGWVGSFACFGLVVTPAVFSVAPESAGALVGPMLAALHLYGGAAGVLLALLAWRLGRGPVLVLLPLAMGAACLASHFGLSGQIHALREAAYGEAGDPQAARSFTRLHQISLGIFLAVSFASVVLVALHAWADACRVRD
jgi:hypothetical protein